ncbi:MAG: hypothetical protein Q9227_005429 [Pyrenula ochraceoflavens]
MPNLEEIGNTLVDLASKDSADGRTQLLDYEKTIIEECFTAGQKSPDFTTYHIRAVRTALQHSRYDLVKLLLDKAPTQDLLEGESDVLQEALKAGQPRWRKESNSLQQVVKLLLRYGASVNSLDQEGNTPIYYTCIYGYSKIFRTLIDYGADYCGLYSRLPACDPDGCQTLGTASGEDHVNLLQIAIDARLADERGLPISCIWTNPLQEKWGDIISFFIDAGLRIRRDDPSLIKFLHIASFQGHLAYIEKILSHGVDSLARSGRSDSRDYVFGSPIHTALLGGQKESARRLLQMGMNICELSVTNITMSGKEDLTPIAAALKSTSALFMRAEPAKVFEACEELVQAGASEEDCRLLMEECAKSGGKDLLMRLVQRGARIPYVPLCPNVEVVRLLVESGAKIEAVQLQEYAAKGGSVELLKFLVEKSGRCLRVEKQMGYITFEVLRGNHMAMLQYLGSEYLEDINTSFWQYPTATNTEYRVNLLQLACLELHTDAAQLLLDEGADVTCPGLHRTAIKFLEDRLPSMSNAVAKQNRIFQVLTRRTDKQGEQEVPATNESFLDRAKLSEKFVDDHQRSKETNKPSSEVEGDVRGSEHGRGGSDYEDDYIFVEKDFKEETTNSGLPSQSSVAAQTTSSASTGRRFSYESLTSSYSVRLLQLEPSDDRDAPIRCRLIQSTLSQKPDFEVLSYDSGGTSNDILVLLNDSDFAITANLWLALRQVRMESEIRLLWVDAICIEQSKVSEKNAQLNIVRDIFSTAQQLLAWVGNEKDNSHLIFKHIRDWKTYRDDYMAGRTTENDAFGERHINMPSFQGSTEEAFQKFCHRPWFYRPWTIQELGLCKKAIIICGSDMEEWSLFKSPFKMQLYDPLNGVDGPTHLMKLHGIRKNAAQEALALSMICEAADPRDKIYSIIGLSDYQMISVNYDLPVVDVFRTFTQRVIELTSNLEILHWTGTERHILDLPSWVPDYSVSKPSGLLPRASGASLFFSASYSQQILPGWQFVGHDLLLRGKCVDSIQALGDEMMADPVCPPGSKEFSRIIRQWENLVTKINHKKFRRHVTHAFLHTLVGFDAHMSPRFHEEDDDLLDLSYHAQHFHAWYPHYGTGVLKKFDADYFHQMKILQDCNHEQQDDYGIKMGFNTYTNDMASACYGRKFFITEQGSMGLAPPQAQNGDSIVFFPGGLYPFVLRGREDGTYTVIGDCYVYDFDDEIFCKNIADTASEYVLR